MKRLFGACALLVTVSLLLCGCNLRNRMPSSLFVPETNASRAVVTEAETEATSVTTVKELTRHSIRTIVSEVDTFTDIYGKQWTYEYRMPFVDFATTEVSTCNIEIERVYDTVIEAQIKLADSNQPLTVPNVDYSCYYTGTLVTLNVWMEMVDGTISRTVYCFRPDGTMATTTEILEAVWITPEDFLSKLTELVQERYATDNAEDADYVTYDTYLNRTLEGIEKIDEISIFADEEDYVTAKVIIYTARGVANTVELPVRP